jgi:hypothetical protein
MHTMSTLQESGPAMLPFGRRWAAMLVLAMASLFATNAVAQDCSEKLRIARESKRKGDYKQAIKQFQAAKGDCGTDRSKEIETEVLGVFDKIDSLKERAERDRVKAEIALRFAYDQKLKAERNEAEANRQRAIARKALDSVQILLDTVQTLIAKGRELQNTFADSSTARYLYKTGLGHFNYDTITQTRDYQNALTYFALARFLQPTDTLTYLVQASQIGAKAEQAFRDGKLDLAKVGYDSIRLLLANIGHETFFEQRRLTQIETVTALFKNFQNKTRSSAEVVVLDGDWWTVPEAMQEYKSIKNITFSNNTSNFLHLPSVLAKMEGMNTLIFNNCPNIRTLHDWVQVPALEKLIVRGNANLFTLDHLEQVPLLGYLVIERCPALTYVEGCRNLQYFSTAFSRQVRTEKLLAENTGLRELYLADLPDDTLHIERLSQLESLGLARMPTYKIGGLERSTTLKTLEMNELSRLTTFGLPTPLEAIEVANCDSLNNFDSWKPSDQLTKIVLFENDRLARLPDWRNYPNLTTLVIQNDEDLQWVYGTRSLSKAENIYLINNPSLVTSSINVGYGFEWGVNITSGKIEYEHRRRAKFRNGRPDLGYKGMAAYVRKRFDHESNQQTRLAQGWLLGGMVNYYSPYWFYTGAGVGLARSYSSFGDNNDIVSERTHFVWLNTLGTQFAPYFLKKDKLSLNMDLYTVFEGKDYYIIPSFGITYYRTLGMHRNTHFIRRGDARRHIWVNGKRKQIGDAAGQF